MKGTTGQSERIESLKGTLRGCAVGLAVALFVAASLFAQEVVLQPTTGHPVSGFDEDQLELFFEGKEQFDRVFLARNGLGPIFDKDSCAGCHSA